MNRRHFLLAIPALAIVPRPKKRYFNMEGYDQFGNRMTAFLTDERDAWAISKRHPDFKFDIRFTEVTA